MIIFEKNDIILYVLFQNIFILHIIEIYYCILIQYYLLFFYYQQMQILDELMKKIFFICMCARDLAVQEL